VEFLLHKTSKRHFTLDFHKTIRITESNGFGYSRHQPRWQSRKGVETRGEWVVRGFFPGDLYS
jgi:hypothetical protein